MDGPDSAGLAGMPRDVEVVDLTGEAVADARHGRDPVLAVRRGAKKLAERRDLHRKIAFLDHGPRPCRLDQIGFGEHFARPLRKSLEKKQSPIAHGNGNLPPKQRSRLGIEDEWTEGEAMALHAGNL